jgi:hypothetical protein
MTNSHAELFNGLLEAGRALEELPQVRAELDKVKADFDEAERMLIDQDRKLANEAATIANLREMLATREAELASATFREAEASAKINNLRAILGTGEPVPVVATEPVGQPQAAASQGEFNADAVGSEPKAQTIDEYVKPPEGPTTTYIGPAAPLSGPDSQATTYGVVEEGEFVSHDPESTSVCIDDPTNAPLPKPYADRPHWQKPSAMSWEEWTEKGGDTPYWWPKEAGQAAF